MNKNIEMEKRVMLTESQFSELFSYASTFNNRKEMTLINHYFDTDSLELRNAHHMLRIRNTNDNEYEITLKIKNEKGDLEINDPVSIEEVNKYIKNFTYKGKEIKEHLDKVTSNKIKYITSLKTERIEIEFKKYLFVLDKNYYSDIVDYNLEIEAHKMRIADKMIKKYCKEFDLQYSKEYKSKSRRAINKALGL